MPGINPKLHRGTSHVSPLVLIDESELVRKNPYLNKLKELRRKVGESSIVEDITGKKYGVDKMTSKDYNRGLAYE